MVVGSSSCTTADHNNIAPGSEPKLENFLGGHPYLNMNNSYSLQLPPAAMVTVASSAEMASLTAREESQSSCGLPLESLALETTKKTDEKSGVAEDMSKKSIETFGQRTSIYRGVTRLTTGASCSFLRS